MERERRKYTIDWNNWDRKPRDYHNPPVWIDYRGKSCMLLCGTSDAVYVFRAPANKEFVVLSMNERLGYIGCQVIDSRDMKQVWDIFFESASEELKDYFRKDIFEYTPNTIASLVLEWWMDR